MPKNIPRREVKKTIQVNKKKKTFRKQIFSQEFKIKYFKLLLERKKSLNYYLWKLEVFYFF